VTASRPALLAGADRAAAAHGSILMKLAGICRAAGQPRAALEAVHRALAIAPLDFTALLLRASLLDRLGEPSAGEAWGHAIAQRPEDPLPPQILQVLAEGERRHAAWLDAREARWAAGMADAEQRASADERARIARFRSNALRRTRPYHSEPTHFSFPGLREREFHPRSPFPWLAAIEAETGTIAAELDAVMAAERAELVPYIQYAAHQPLRQWQALKRNPDSTAIHRCARRPRPPLDGAPRPGTTGAPPKPISPLPARGPAIPPHVGVNNARLVCHLPLIVPEGCWFRVGAETRHWRRGEAFVFDDTIEHEAMNPSDRLRVVLIFDLWHPDLSEIEREAVAALIGSDAANAPAAP